MEEKRKGVEGDVSADAHGRLRGQHELNIRGNAWLRIGRAKRECEWSTAAISGKRLVSFRRQMRALSATGEPVTLTKQLKI